MKNYIGFVLLFWTILDKMYLKDHNFNHNNISVNKEGYIKISNNM